MSGFSLLTNFIENPDKLVRRVRPRIVPPPLSQSTSEPALQAPSTTTEPMAEKTLRDFSVPSAAVRPGTVGLLIDIECSRVRDSSWMYLTSFVTTQIGIELAAVQRKLPDCVVVVLQPYSARTFHVTLSPRIYKGRQGPPRNTSTPKEIQATTQDVGYCAIFVFLAIQT